jgi:nucleotide-binding universal stress UspA family protein
VTIVVGYVNTPEGDAAIDTAASEAELRGARIVVVHSMFGGSRDKGEEYIASAEAMERIHAELTGRGIEHSVHEYVRGQTPAEDLVQAAQEYEAGLIVIGIRRRSATGKILLGSNALEILHDATCPVLCVKAKA